MGAPKHKEGARLFDGFNSTGPMSHPIRPTLVRQLPDTEQSSHDLPSKVLKPLHAHAVGQFSVQVDKASDHEFEAILLHADNQGTLQCVARMACSNVDVLQ